MTKHKKLFGLFAVLFVALFSVGCVFATACKKNKDNDEESVPEHVHAYTELNQGDANGHYYTCPDDGEKGEVTAHTYGEWTTTKAATCGDYGTQERSCTVCGYTETDTTTLVPTGEHTYTDKDKVTFVWTEDETKGYTVSATISCAVCGKAPVEVTDVTVEGPEDGEFYGTYTATAKYGDVIAMETKELKDPSAAEELVTKVELDFADSSTYSWITTDGTIPNETSYTYGMLTLVTTTGATDTGEANTAMKVESNVLKVGGSSAGNKGRYFIIDLSNYVDLYGYVSISVTMKTGSSDKARSLYIDSQYNETPSVSSGTAYAYVTSSKDSESLNYVDAIDANNPYLYLTYDNNIQISTLTVEVGDNFVPTAASSVNVAPSTLGLSLGDGTNQTGTLNASVVVASGTYDAGYDWLSSDEAVATVEGDGATATVAAIGEGTATITLIPRGDAKNTATCEVTVTAGGDTGEGGEGTEPSGASVELSESNITLAIGGQDAVVEATVTGYEGTYSWTGSEWTSSDTNESVIKITPNGNSVTIEAVGTGTATVTVTLEGVGTASLTVTVSGDIVAGVWEGTAEFHISAMAGIIDVDLYATATVTVEEKTTGNTFKLEIANLTTGNSSTDSTLDGLLGILGIEGVESLEGMATYFLFEGTWQKEGDIYWVTGYIDETNSITLPVTVSYINGQYKLCLSMETTLWSVIDLTIADAKIGLKDVEAPEEGVENVKVTYDKDTFTAGNSATATVTVTMAGESGEYSGTYTWTSSDESVFTVSGSGATATLSFVGAGSAVLKVELNDGSYVKYVVTVEAAPSVTLAAKSGVTFGKIGDSGNIEAEVTMPDESSYGGNYAWTSSDNTVATVVGGTGQIFGIGTPKNEAKVTIVGAGTTIITVTLDDGTYATMTITIPDSYEIEIDDQNVVVTEGDTVQLTAIVYKNGETLETVTLTWSSSDNTYATVDGGGIVTGVAAGETTITVKYTYGEGDGDFVGASVTVKVISKAQAEAETRVTAKSETAALNEVEFKNQEDVSFVFDHVVSGNTRTDGYQYDEIWISAQGTASAMTKDQAEAFTSLGDTFAHDPYVIVTVNVKAGETLSTSATNSTYYADDTTEAFVIKVSNYGYWQFKITTSEDSVGTMYVIDFTQMTPAAVVHTAGTGVACVDGEYFYVCTECGETFGEALTSAEGVEIAVATAEELSTAAKLSGAGITINSDIAGAVEVTATDVTITIGEGTTLSNSEGDTVSTITVKSGASLTIEGSGTVDSVANNCAAILVEEGGTAILNGGTFTRSGENTTGGTNYTIVNHGTLTIGEGVTVETDAVTGSSMVENGGTETNATMTITGGTFKSSGNSMIKNDVNGTLIIANGEFTGNGNTAVILNCAELEISGGTFIQANTTATSNLVVWNYDYGGSLQPSAKISGGSFSGGTKGTVYNDAQGTMEISGGNFDNSLWATVVSEGELAIDGGTFTSSGSGAFIYLVWACGGKITISGGTFTAGDASDYDVVASNSGSVEIYGGVFGGVGDTTILCAKTDEDTLTVCGGTFSADPSEFVKAPYFVAAGMDEDSETVYTVEIYRVRALEDGDTFAGTGFTLESFEYRDIVINADGSIEYQITATGGMMSSEQNVAFGGGDEQYSKEGDLYVSFKIWVNAGETISWVKDGVTMYEKFEEAGWFVFVIRVDTSDLPEETTSCSIGKHYFAISDGEGNSTTIIVNFGHIDFPEGYVLGGGSD